MCDLGMNAESFNPAIFYVLKRKFYPESEIKYHCHDYSTIIHILSGSCTYNIDDKLYNVKKGDTIIINPMVYHGKKLNANEETIEFHIGFSNIHLKDLANNHIIKNDSSPIINLGKYEDEFIKCCSEILSEQEKNEIGGELMLKSLTMKLIVLVLKATYVNSHPQENNTFSFETYEKASIVNTIISYINENYMNMISLDKLSRNMYLSPAYISKIFKEEIGDSPINYLIKVRLSKADEILKEGRLSVKEAAKCVGYDDAYYFSKLYKKYYGYPPSKTKNRKE